jgi:hypothetical protein
MGAEEKNGTVNMRHGLESSKGTFNNYPQFI